MYIYNLLFDFVGFGFSPNSEHYAWVKHVTDSNPITDKHWIFKWRG